MSATGFGRAFFRKTGFADKVSFKEVMERIREDLLPVYEALL